MKENKYFVGPHTQKKYAKRKGMAEKNIESLWDIFPEALLR
ncbi:hypothetical protein [Chlorobaculum sp. 24CR]|nr:hypothetical protein [Chlorobaculum sp. 24CR]